MSPRRLAKPDAGPPRRPGARSGGQDPPGCRDLAAPDEDVAHAGPVLGGLDARADVGVHHDRVSQLARRETADLVVDSEQPRRVLGSHLDRRHRREPALNEPRPLTAITSRIRSAGALSEMWTWTSMRPGSTAPPAASTTRASRGTDRAPDRPTNSIRSPSSRTASRRGSAPVPSTTCPPTIAVVAMSGGSGVESDVHQRLAAGHDRARMDREHDARMRAHRLAVAIAPEATPHEGRGRRGRGCPRSASAAPG